MLSRLDYFSVPVSQAQQDNCNSEHRKCYKSGKTAIIFSAVVGWLSSKHSQSIYDLQSIVGKPQAWL